MGETLRAVAFVLWMLIRHPVSSVRVLWAIDYQQMWTEIAHTMSHEQEREDHQARNGGLR